MLARFGLAAVSLSREKKSYIMMAFDVVAVFSAMVLTYLLLSSIVPFPELGVSSFWAFAVVAAVTVIASIRLGLPFMKLNSYESQGVGRSAFVAAVAGVAAAVVNPLFGLGWPMASVIVFALLFAYVSVFGRMALRQLTLYIYTVNGTTMRVLIYGAGKTGQQLAAALRGDSTIRAVAFVDDNPTLQSTTISGLRVYASSKITQLVGEKQIDRVVLAMPSLGPARQARIAHELRKLGCEVHALPSFAELVGTEEMRRSSVPVALDRLLGRNRVEEQLPGVSEAYKGRRILVTGAGGSIGSELCRQLLSCDPACVVMLDHGEHALYQIDKELRELTRSIDIVPVLGSVCDPDLVRQVIRDHDVDVILHAAAYKHLPLVQMNPLSGLRNNVFGTKIVADAARDCGVERFILVSTDKAVRPKNVMGASKRLAEMVVQDLATRSGRTIFSMVRFGNVLGSSGSVIPLFEEQIARGGPVTLTDPNVTRYFMTISEATRLVLLAGSLARGGDVFVLDMGEPVPIARLARQMIEGAGFTVKDENNPDGDIEIKITGLREGEKLNEELLIAPDMLTTPHHKILRAQESFLSEIEIATALKDLRRAIDLRDVDAAHAVIGRWVESAAPKAASVGASTTS